MASDGTPRLTTPAGEAELLERLRAGDEEAFATLVGEFGGRMLAAARRLLGHEHDARDAVQDAFLSVFKALDTFKGEARLSTWLHRIAINAALMKLRTRKRHPETPIEDLLPRYDEDGRRIDPGPPWRETAEDALARQETRELVRERIDRLPEIYRNVLLLRDIEGLDTEETARVLGESATVVKVRLHRARQALRTLLDPYFRSEP